MEVRNKTAYLTTDLRKFFLRGIRAEGMDPKGYCIVVEYRGYSRYRGWGSYGSKWIKILLPDEPYPNLVRDYAGVLVHEIAHNRGLRHKDMSYKGWDLSFAAGLSLRLREQKPKAPRNLRLERFEHAKGLLSRHESKLKREQKLVKK